MDTETTVTTHDLTQQKWGNGISIWTPRSNDGTKWKIVGHSANQIKINDRIIVEGDDNDFPVYYLVKEIEYKMSVRDMFEATIEYIPGVRCNVCHTWYEANDPIVIAGTACPVCENRNAKI